MPTTVQCSLLSSPRCPTRAGPGVTILQLGKLRPREGRPLLGSYCEGRQTQADGLPHAHTPLELPASSPRPPPNALPLQLRAARAWAGGAASINHLALIFPSPDPNPLGSAGPGQQQTGWAHWGGGRVDTGAIEGLLGVVSTGQVGKSGSWGAESPPGQRTMGAVSQPPPFLGGEGVLDRERRTDRKKQTCRQRQSRRAGEGKRK